MRWQYGWRPTLRGRLFSEEGVYQCHLGRDAIRRVDGEKLLEQIQARRGQARHQARQTPAGPVPQNAAYVFVALQLAEGARDAGVAKGTGKVEGVCVRKSDAGNAMPLPALYQLPEDQRELVFGPMPFTGAAPQERLACSEFGEDAADRPHVDGGGVRRGAKKQFRGAVAEGAHL